MNVEERQAQLEKYRRAWDELIAALNEFPREMWQHKPAPDSWSIHEQIIHLPDSEQHSSSRFRCAIAQPGVTIFAYDQDIWADTLDYHAQSPDDALELLRHIRKANYDVLSRLPIDGEVWSQTIEHPENGTMSLDNVLATYADHPYAHIQQMRACYEDWLEKR